MDETLFSRGPKGEAKFEYLDGEDRKTLVIEPLEEGVLETVFDNEGGVLNQVAVKGGNDVLFDEIYGMLKRSSSVRKVVYNGVMLNKTCPHCSSKGVLNRDIEPSVGIKGIPVVPTYVCSSCGGKSYYLTDTHLKSMVSENRERFSENELKELDESEEKFLEELKGYIIRIFASKRIIAIK
jgi:hypothetical protein